MIRRTYMLENVLKTRNLSLKAKITLKFIVAVSVVAMAVVLPQIVHAAAGSEGGAAWLPMYLPVLLGGCILGVWWGIGVGVASPVVSYLLSSLAGEAMPSAARLPFMVIELAVFAAVSGAFSSAIYKKAFWAFPAVWLAVAAGRGAFVVSAAVLGSVTGFSPETAWSQIVAGYPGLIILTLLVPCMVIALRKLIIKGRNDE